MAYFPTEDEEQQKQQAGATNENVLSSNAGGAITGGAPGSSQPQAGQQSSLGAGQKGTGFVNIQDYVAANKGVGQGLAEKTAGALGQEASEAETGIGNLSQGFQAKANAQNLEADEGVLSDIKAGKAAGVTNQQDRLKRFQEMAGAQYAGPRGLEDTEGYQGQVQKNLRAQQNLGLADTEQGQVNLLQQKFGRAGYTGRDAALDRAFMALEPGAIGNLQSVAKQKRESLGQKFAAAEAEAQKIAQDREAKAQALRDMAYGAVSQGFGGLKGKMESDLVAAQAAEKAAADDYARQLARDYGISEKGANRYGRKSEDIFSNLGNLEELGISEAKARAYAKNDNPNWSKYLKQEYVGAAEKYLDPRNFINKKNAIRELGLADVAGAGSENRANYEALMQLMGDRAAPDQAFLPSEAGVNYSGRGQPLKEMFDKRAWNDAVKSVQRAEKFAGSGKIKSMKDLKRYLK